MNKPLMLFITCISISSCVSVDRPSNTTNFYEYNMTFEQACILKNHYQNQDENIPSSVQAVIDESESVCE
jgi:hypothetical protein